MNKDIFWKIVDMSNIFNKELDYCSFHVNENGEFINDSITIKVGFNNHYYTECLTYDLLYALKDVSTITEFIIQKITNVVYLDG